MGTTSNSSSLMKKTKQDLVNIILRKDDVHKDLNEKIETLVKERDDAFAQNKKLNSALANINLENKRLNRTVDGYQSALDEDASIIQENKNKLKFWSSMALIEAVILIIVMIVITLL